MRRSLKPFLFGFMIGSTVIGITSYSKLPLDNISFLISPPPTPTPTIQPTTIPTHTPTSTPTNTPKPTPTIKPKPTNTPTPTVKPYTAQDMDRWFASFSRQYAVEESLLKKIAVCESYLRPQAVNGPYAGLYQFDETTWKPTRIAMGKDSNPLLRIDPEAAIETAAYLLNKRGMSPWPSCSQ